MSKVSKPWLIRLGLSLPLLIAAVYLYGRLHQASEPKALHQTTLYNRIPILLFHNIDGPGRYAISRHEFRQYLEIIKNENIQIISLKTLHEMMLKNQAATTPSMVITIDDDYKNIARIAAPMLREYGYPATFFVYTGQISHRPQEGMAWDDLRRLQKEGFDVQSHSHSHTAFHEPYHGESDDDYAKRVDTEVVMSRRILEENLGHTIWCFAYPMGYKSAYIEKRLKEAGYELVLTTDARPADTTMQYHGSLDRFTIQQGPDPWGLFASQVSLAKRALKDSELTLQAPTNNPTP